MPYTTPATPLNDHTTDNFQESTNNSDSDFENTPPRPRRRSYVPRQNDLDFRRDFINSPPPSTATRASSSRRQSSERETTVNIGLHDLHAFEIEEIETVTDISFEEIEYPELPANNEDVIEVSIRRDNVLEEVFKLYDENEGLVQRKIKLSFENESGLDYGGLTKKLFSEFWKACTRDYFRGENRTAPFLPLSKIRKGLDHKFCLIGRVLAHNLILTKTIPIKLCKYVFLKLGSLDNDIPQSILLEDFFNFLTPSEACLLRKAKLAYQTLTEKDKELLLDLFSTYGLLENPNASEIEDQIVTIAENVLCQESFPFIKKIKDGIPLFCEHFFSNLTESKINYLFKKQAATASKFFEIMITTPEELNNLQTRILYFFKTYIKNLTDEKLQRMLFFISGSTNMPERVVVAFTASGYPVAHTCSNTLELALSYSSYQEIKLHFDAILDNETAFEYSYL
ncbi:unnamed protein product [Brassicogethes aeneus]|uniref:HECT-type E3 ubiquitin transferase n=1 Tax=Brassicogethes aeneus TaxID=1431903 RepID=A0A9P0FMH8_BRAAE|nr:unnamed protein product [Brassicogethes aeneus]